MVIHNELDWEGKKYLIEYHDADSFDGLPHDRCKQVYGVCFVGERFVIGFRGAKNTWGLIGGSIEEGETFETTFRREIQEEANMRVVWFVPVGYQKVVPSTGEPFYQLRFCAVVEPLGPFVSDPAGSITEIVLVSPDEYKKYFNWGEIGERIIKRAVELKKAGNSAIVGRINT